MSEPVRVLFLDTVMDRGGAETMTMNYLRNIDRSRVQFDFLVHQDYKAAYEDEIAELGGKIYRMCLPYPWNYFRYTQGIRRLFHEHPEYQIIHSNMMENALFAYEEAKRCGIPVRICHAHIAKTNQRLSAKSIAKLYFKKRMQKSITHRFACGVDAGKWVFGENAKDVIYMHNAIDAAQFQYHTRIEAEVRKEFSIENKFVIGHVGRFFKQKNHPFIIDIFAEIAKRDENSVLMLVGGGELDDATMNQMKEKVKRLSLADRVIFTGVRTDVNRIIQAFDVFILPSLYEGFPVVMVEAQAAGLKCVMSDTITRECAITGNVESIPLDDGAAHWAERILSYRGTYQKRDMYDEIVAVGYDIKENAKWLEEFYISALEQSVKRGGVEPL